MTVSELESIKSTLIPENKADCFNSWPLEYRRVKLYEVNPENGNWIDCGTGFLKINKDDDKFNLVVSFFKTKYSFRSLPLGLE